MTQMKQNSPGGMHNSKVVSLVSLTPNSLLSSKLGLVSLACVVNNGNDFSTDQQHKWVWFKGVIVIQKWPRGTKFLDYLGGYLKNSKWLRHNCQWQGKTDLWKSHASGNTYSSIINNIYSDSRAVKKMKALKLLKTSAICMSNRLFLSTHGHLIWFVPVCLLCCW